MTTRRPWLGMVLAPAAWALQEGLNYFFASEACSNSNRVLGPLTPTGARIWVGIITLVTLALALWGASAGWSAWRARPSSGMAEAEGWALGDFLALASIMIGVLLAVGIIYGGLPLIFVDPCMRMR